jgi:hypothetical protein
MTLVEVVLAMGLMAVVITSVGTAVRLLSKQSTIMTEGTVSIDQLQVAEQTIVRYIHAAAPVGNATTPWCNGSSPSATPSAELKFTARINGGTTAYDIKINGGELTVASAANCAALGSGATLVANLTASSIFTEAGCPSTTGCPALPATPTATWNGGSGATYSYYPALGVSLTISGPNGVNTTVADENVDLWNVEDACQASWQIDPQTSPAMKDPC